jgi:hypothetical protein
MNGQSTSFPRADVIASKLDLYAAKPPSETNRRSFAVVERAFRLGAKRTDALAAELDRAIDQ